MTIFCTLGRVPELSLLEIERLLPVTSITSCSDTIAVLEVPDGTDLSGLMHQLGGTIKIGMVVAEEPFQEPEGLAIKLAEQIAKRVGDTGKITFGLSAYTLTRKGQQSYGPRLLKTIGKATKDCLVADGRSVRFVPLKGDERILSSASVEHNKLLRENGVEIVLLSDEERTLIGVTSAVQAFEEYSRRDWGRPQRDMDVGLLPPKLAQMMINLAGHAHNKHLKIVDPFCGFGTILQEALLLGYTNTWGSDLNQEMVTASKKNLAWLTQQKDLPLNLGHIAACDARTLSRIHKPSSINAIVTEPYLGPVRTKKSTFQNLLPVISSLSALYSGFLKEVHPLLKNNGVIVMVWPVWLSRGVQTFLPLYEKLPAIGYAAEKTVPHHGVSKHITARGTILIAREGQQVGRELILLKRV